MPKIDRKGLLKVPPVFYSDHEGRDLPTPGLILCDSTGIYIDPNDPACPEFLSDALFYADRNGPDAPGLQGLKASARATVKALQAAGIKPTEE